MSARSENASNASYQLVFGTRSKSFTFDFITNTTRANAVAEELLDSFKAPKPEFKVKIPTRVALGFDLLDRVSVDFPLRYVPKENCFLPAYGSAVYGDTETPYPYRFGSMVIKPGYEWKILEMSHDPKTFITELLLRQKVYLVLSTLFLIFPIPEISILSDTSISEP